MPITYAQAKQVLSQYQGRGGKCPTNEEINLFVRQVLEYLLISGAYGNIRKFTFNAHKGCFTVPFELEVPLKIKIDGEVGSSWDRWFEWHDRKELDAGCVPASEALQEDPNYYPTVYDVPAPGERIGALGTCNEADDAHLIVQGVGGDGREIFSVHDGKQISGEYLRIRKGELRYTQNTFAKITGVLKTPTFGYVQLLWVSPGTTFDSTGFLSDYSPVEEKPSYRRYRITSRHCGTWVKLSVLGRIRLKAAYSDNDYIPFDSLNALSLAGQVINSRYNKDLTAAQAQDSMLQDVVARENEYKRVQNGQPLEVYGPTSAGCIKNIV
jgi:hypothetical protein